MNQIIASLKGYVYGLSLPKIGVVDILEIIIIAFALYHVTFWVKRTRAWTLVKGVFVLFSAYIVRLKNDQQRCNTKTDRLIKHPQYNTHI